MSITWTGSLTRWAGGRKFCSVAKQDVHVEQIRIGRTRDEQIAGGGEKRIGVVVVERRARGAPSALAPRDARRVDDPARGVGRAVGAVGAGSEHAQAIIRRQLQRRRERELLTAPAPARALHAYRRLAAGDEARARRQSAGARDELARDLPGLAL